MSGALVPYSYGVGQLAARNYLYRGGAITTPLASLPELAARGAGRVIARNIIRMATRGRRPIISPPRRQARSRPRRSRSRRRMPRRNKLALMSMGKSYNYHTHKKKLQQNFHNEGANTRSLHFFQFTELNQGDVLNQREGHRIKMKGVKLRMTFKNNDSDNILQVRWAIVIPKNVQTSTISTAGGTSPFTVLTTYDDFFDDNIGRRAGADTDTIEFGQSSSHESQYNKINRDNFDVLTGGQCTLLPNAVSSSRADFRTQQGNPPDTMKGWKHTNKFVKIYRSLHYPSTQIQPDSRYPLLCVWCDFMNTAAQATASTTNPLQLSMLNTLVYEEPY